MANVSLKACFPTNEQNAALRHALLLEERGLRLERVEALLRRKVEEETVLLKELHRLEVASAVGRVRKRYNCYYVQYYLEAEN